MASIKVSYLVQSCPACEKKLLKVAAGTQIIGSPLITCPRCKRTYRTNLRVEWVDYKTKYMLWLLPLLLGVSGPLVGLMMEDLAIGVAAGMIMLLIGLCISAKDVVRMIQSKRRMRNPEYLKQLLEYDVITQEQYSAFVQKCR